MISRRSGRGIAILTFIFLCFAHAVSAGIHVEKVIIGLNGYVRAERWVPAVFYLTNTANDFQGKLELIKGDTVFYKSLDIAAGTTKRTEILYYHSNFYESIRYQILDGKGHLMVTDHLNPIILNYQDNLLLVISEEEYNHQFLNGRQNPWGGKTFVAYLRPQELYSDWIAYAGADAVALGSFSPSEVLPAQWTDLMQYTASGGVLITSTATSFSILQNHLLRENLPVISPESNLTTRGEFLVSRWTSTFSEEFPDMEIPAQTVVARPSDRQLIVTSTGSSLVTSSPYYKGNILYFAFDYTRLPEPVRNIFAGLWNETIFPVSMTPPSFSLPFRKRLEENPRFQKFLYDIPGLRLPDMKWFALFFFIYLCAIGPFQYVLLKVLKKNSLLWFTFPAIILLFSVTSFGYSKFRRSNESRITQAAVVEIFPRLGRQTLYQVYATAITESGTFRFQALPENSYLRKYVMQALTYQPEPFVLSEDVPRQLEGEVLKSWTFRTFDAFSTGPISLPVSLNYSVRGKILRGKIRNSTNFPIRDSFFYYDSRDALSLGFIPAGTTKSFSLPLDHSSAVPFAASHLNDLLHLYNQSHSAPHFFFGELQEPNGAILINGKLRNTSILKYIAVHADANHQEP